MPTTDTLPPLTTVGTGLPAAAWLDAGGGRYAHYYAAGQNTAACGRWRNVAAVRAAWTGATWLPALPK